jgi:hypothetical protein
VSLLIYNIPFSLYSMIFRKGVGDLKIGCQVSKV